MVTIHTVTYNEESIIGFFINQYRSQFPNCKIKIYDNYSTDNTVKIAKELNCEIYYYDSDNKFSDDKIIEVKNNCWKDSETDWVVVCDCDEIIQITEKELINEDINGTTIFKFNGYNIFNDQKIINFEDLTKGFPDESYDKILLFNKSKIKEINYNYGCHSANPVGKIKYNNSYKLFHYRFLGEEYSIKKYKLYGDRLSKENIEKGLSIHYLTEKQEIKRFYKNNKNYLINLK